MKKWDILSPLSIFFLIVITGCGSYNDKSSQSYGPETVLVDNLALYEDWESPTLASSTVTIPVPNDYLCRPWNDLNASPRPCTLDDVLHDTDPYDDYKPELHVDLSVVSDIVYTSKATFKLKGKTTRTASQKSFRIKVDDKTHLYKGQRTFQLGKHPYDDSRVRNKLFFDLFVKIPHLNSLRTKFMDLKIDGQPYGLFTHVERVDKYYLMSRGLPDNGRIYKAQNFDFRYSSAFALDKDGKPIDQQAFDKKMEIMNGKNHETFVEMLHAIDTAETEDEIDELFRTYFDRQNYLTWLAVNYISGNIDTISQNFFLYNPKGSKKFYFIPWDYDDTANDTKLIPKWQLGYGRYWQIPLHRKFLSIANNRNDLDAMIDQIYAAYMNPDIVKERLKLYRPVVEPFIKTPPDSKHLTYDTWQKAFDILPDRIAQDVSSFKSQKGVPMPYWQNYRVDRTGKITLIWERSIDFEGDPIVYDVWLAKSPDGNGTIYKRNNIPEEDIPSDGTDLYLSTGVTVSNGTYFMKVVAKERNNPSHWQIAQDIYENGTEKFSGVLKIEIQ